MQKRVQKGDKEAPSFCKQKSWRICRFRRPELHDDGRYTSVTTGSMRNLLRTGEILASRDANDDPPRRAGGGKKVGGG